MAALGLERLPLLDLVAPGPARRRRARSTRRAALLPRARRGTARARDRAGRDALPLGPAAAAAGRRRLGRPRHRAALRRLRAAHGARARRPGEHLDHPQRAVGGDLPRPRAGQLRARRARLADGAGRQPSPAALPRPGAAGAPGQRRDHAEPVAGASGRARRRGGRAALRRPPQPLVPGPGAAGSYPEDLLEHSRGAWARSTRSATATSRSSPARSPSSGSTTTSLRARARTATTSRWA